MVRAHELHLHLAEALHLVERGRRGRLLAVPDKGEPGPKGRATGRPGSRRGIHPSLAGRGDEFAHLQFDDIRRRDVYPFAFDEGVAAHDPRSRDGLALPVAHLP